MVNGVQSANDGSKPETATSLEASTEHSSETLDHNRRTPQLPLPTRLRDSLVRCPHEGSQAFLPKDSLDRIMTPENIAEYISTSVHFTLRDRSSDVIDYVCGELESKGSGIFAVLLLMEQPHLIMEFMEERITDNDLPLCLRDEERNHFTQYCLGKQVGNSCIPIERFDHWESMQRFAFSSHQWWVKLPVFGRSTSKSLDSHPAIRLHNSSILPWVEYKAIYHQNSDVVRVRIHDAHHTFQPEENKAFAIKSLKSDVIAFQLEVKALLKIKSRRHLVKLLTTFEHQNHYHLIFRWAEGGNLADLWKKHVREPILDHGRVCWFGEQCYGLAHGLDGIHDTKLSQREVDEIQGSPMSTPPVKTASQSQYLTVKQDGVHANALRDGDCGRHGDIKPENVLWFSQDSNQFGHGELKISDFGLTTFHSMLTTKVSPRGIAVTHTYMAPEYDLNEDLSRPFDIWSLGCTYLEFITWMLLGADGLEQFSKIRLRETGTNKNFVCDNFYKIIREGNDRRAEVKVSVETWMGKLKQHFACSAFLSDFLDYIQTSMMILNKSKRSGVKQVAQWLRSRYEACLKDEAYALRSPVCQEPRTNQSKRKRSFDGNDGNDGYPLKR